MAHPCFCCSGECYCNGSIDDVIVDKTPKNCNGCDHCQEQVFDREKLYDEIIEGVCHECKTHDYLVDVLDPETGEPTGKLLCHDCCGNEGHCFGCGVLASDDLEYHNSRIGNYCANCQEQILDNYEYD
ncbi:hypothetical protein [Runella sp. SP2]|uniref:hypothetical protein n=1 Tax=Runella sp. SP2 TaxID=2268026 RepID=UPI000F08B277|nr:hypothetical protein [Runella sp. SP2]AYQ31420.1 hypothetical protein DTQ70_04150 [Runella sp. SP2]